MSGASCSVFTGLRSQSPSSVQDSDLHVSVRRDIWPEEGDIRVTSPKVTVGWLLATGLSNPLPAQCPLSIQELSAVPCGCLLEGCGRVSCFNSSWGELDPEARTPQGGQESRRGLESRGGAWDKQPPYPPTHPCQSLLPDSPHCVYLQDLNQAMICIIP